MKIIVLVLVIKARRLAHRRNKHGYCSVTRQVHYAQGTEDCRLGTVDSGQGTDRS